MSAIAKVYGCFIVFAVLFCVPDAARNLANAACFITSKDGSFHVGSTGE